MPQLPDQYRQLLTELRLHITEEYAAGSWISSAPETFEYFKQHAQQKVRQAQNKVQETHTKPTAINATPPSHKLEAKSISRVPPPTQAPISTSQREHQAASDSDHTTTSPTKPAPPPASVDLVESGLEKVAKVQKSSVFKKEPPPPLVEGDYADIQQFLAKKFPHIALHSTPPKDDLAKAFINQWNAPLTYPRVLILTFNENAKEKLFLSNLKHALDTEFGCTTMYSGHKAERQNSWNALLANQQLMLIIAHKGKMEALDGLMKYYREDPQPMLGKVRIYPLCDISLYIQEPTLKADLWQALSTFLHKRTLK